MQQPCLLLNFGRQFFPLKLYLVTGIVTDTAGNCKQNVSICQRWKMEDGRKRSQAAAGSLTAIWKPGLIDQLWHSEKISEDGNWLPPTAIQGGLVSVVWSYKWHFEGALAGRLKKL